jgi:2-polyprenyl-3-methyl-5-hydroxy-6-metoxy-1,4-benzoquinol methylase
MSTSLRIHEDYTRAYQTVENAKELENRSDGEPMAYGMRNIIKRVLLRDTTFAARYNRLAALYWLEDPWGLHAESERYRFRKTNELLVQLAGNARTLLEIGCGEGHHTSYLVKLQMDVYGLDVSERAIKRARRRCPSAVFGVGTAEDAAKIFAAVSFDMVVACEVLYYAKDIVGIIQKLQRFAPRMFISNYFPRSRVMKEHFAGPGWLRLENIEYGDSVWECVYWQRLEPALDSLFPSTPSP